MVQAADRGLIVVNRHHGERHMNLVPLEWILDNVAGTETGSVILRKWLDKQGSSGLLTKTVG